MVRKLKIDWMELDAAFQSGSWEMRHHLDLETGEVVMVTDEIARYLEEPPDSELPAWMQQAIREAEQVEEGGCEHGRGTKIRRATRPAGVWKGNPGGQAARGSQPAPRRQRRLVPREPQERD